MSSSGFKCHLHFINQEDVSLHLDPQYAFVKRKQEATGQDDHIIRQPVDVYT